MEKPGDFSDYSYYLMSEDWEKKRETITAAVHQRFCYERYVVLLRLLNQGLDKKGIRAATNLTPQFINKWCGDRECLVSAIKNYEANERRIEEGLYNGAGLFVRWNNA